MANRKAARKSGKCVATVRFNINVKKRAQAKNSNSEKQCNESKLQKRGKSTNFEMRASKQLRQTNNLSDGQTNTELKNGENRMDLWVNNWLDFDFYSATYG